LGAARGQAEAQDQQELAGKRDEFKKIKEMRNMSTGIPSSQIAGERFIGQVEWFSERKGYGFIGWQEDDDVFVHRSAILSQGRKTLQEGQKVEFEVKRTPRGSEAIDVIELPRGAEKGIDHPMHNPRASKGQVHRARRRQRGSDSARTQTEPFVYSYTVRKR
jgi:CspA family cold shock protein